MKIIDNIQFKKHIYGCIDGATELTLEALIKQFGKLVFIARDDVRMKQMQTGLAAINQNLEIITLPAWDCLPYDRVSPHSAITSKRMVGLSLLAGEQEGDNSNTSHKIYLTTINSWLQKIPPASYFRDNTLTLSSGQEISPAEIAEFLTLNGFIRTQTVREYGEFSVRGNIFDIFVHSDAQPVRLDFFGDQIETIRFFDSLSQRSEGMAGLITLRPANEYRLDDDVISQFRQAYLSLFGGESVRDPLYEAVSAGQNVAGLEHWLSLLHSELVPLSSYFENWRCVFDIDALPAAQARLDLINDFYQSRLEAISNKDESLYRPVPPIHHFLGREDIANIETADHTALLFQFAAPSDSDMPDTGARAGPNFGAVASSGGRPSEVASEFITRECGEKIVVLCASTAGALVRMSELLGAYMQKKAVPINNFAGIRKKGIYGLVWPLSSGFVTKTITLLTEQDIFGSQIARPQGRRRRADNFLKEVSSLEIGDLVVHVEHGIGRYQGLETIRSEQSEHDCLHLVYAGGDKLYLPVENIELLSRYGQDSSDASLDKLGSAAWQNRKARIKGKIRDMADQLIKIAAKREVAKTESLSPPEGVFAEFCARFEYTETDDQLDVLDDVFSDLAGGRASDRLICGDVGFGKTEIALRAAFVVSMSGYQVALVTPTTLLARQHGRLFKERFKGFPICVDVLSRMVTSGQAKQIKSALHEGSVQVVIGTHALLSKSISFSNLGLLIIDEEQNFGVVQKERLKEMKGDIHVLTLSATPIPRTLQLALSGVRQMSIMATPPVDRLAVRTFIGSWDGMVLREAILRERFRGGQVFVVCPRISDLFYVHERLVKLVPDLRILTAHGKISAGELDDVMTKFSDGRADLLLSTNIIESGIDIPTANTIIIHRSDRFSLSQLYQLRGRVGRSKERAYAYLTTNPQQVITKHARRRLDVMQTLDKLGAGFSLASYDMDIRGAGNLLGDAQSGHIKEVGVELYQDLLKQAVESAKLEKQSGGEDGGKSLDQWSPQISIGTNILIPNSYVEDLSIRLSLYRRIGSLHTKDDINELHVELVDRFGPIPATVTNLLELVAIKQLCKQLNIEKIDAGDKGFALSFRQDHFAEPEALIGWITAQRGRVQLKANHRLIIKADLTQISQRSQMAQKFLSSLLCLLEPEQAA